MRALLEGIAATDEDRALVRSAGGRPSLNLQGTGKSPLWQIRAPQELDRAMREQAEQVGRNFSEVLRDAAEAYLRGHRAG
ncbi:hypothetical protein B5P43_15220 [Bacillus sp. SRB_336]|nr:hypothetical protein B5P43_15220 [Bacillus sp. SRB_336]